MHKNILYEDEEILVVCKPAGIATQTARIGQRDMVSELKNYLAGKQKEKREPYLGLIHRLDQPVAGLLVFAKTKGAAANLSRQLTDRSFHKYYYAVVLGRVTGKEKLVHYLYKDNKTNMSKVTEEGFPGAQRAELSYIGVNTLTALEIMQETTLVEIELFTGRHHQIRAQMAYAGMPLLGDSKYGSAEDKEFSREIGLKNVALFAYKLEFRHPKTEKELCFKKMPEEEIFRPFLRGKEEF